LYGGEYNGPISNLHLLLTDPNHYTVKKRRSNPPKTGQPAIHRAKARNFDEAKANARRVMIYLANVMFLQMLQFLFRDEFGKGPDSWSQFIANMGIIHKKKNATAFNRTLRFLRVELNLDDQYGLV
jgi:hypothetical protein